MNEYVQQAKDFMKSCNATSRIVYVGLENPHWDNKPHCTYDCTIKTPKGEMKVHFYDSIANTELHQMTTEQYYEKTYKKYYKYADQWDRQRASRELHEKQEKARPTIYDILACLQKYDVGNMDDFMYEFGYEIKRTKDMTNFINTYNAVVKEYQDICRCFTEEQIEAMQEIQ